MPMSTRRIIWIACLIAVGVYGVVGFTVLAGVFPDPSVPGWVWMVVAVGMVMSSLAAPRLMQAGGSGGFTAQVLAWSFAEGVAVVGMVAAMFGASRGTLLAYLAVSLVLLLLQRPVED